MLCFNKIREAIRARLTLGHRFLNQLDDAVYTLDRPYICVDEHPCGTEEDAEQFPAKSKHARHHSLLQIQRT